MSNNLPLSVLVTGANGFVGRGLCAALEQAGHPVVRAVRRANMPGEQEVGDIDGHTRWAAPLANPVDAVVHLAARVHLMHDRACNPLTEFRKINVEGTLNLARQAATAGVKRFVFISSIKVNGEASRPGQPFTSEGEPAPVDPYGISKMEAEIGLRKIAAEAGMELVIIRPPLVYGPGVKANFHTMLNWIGKGVPLPFGAIDNQRSLVGLDNLVGLIMTCIVHPAAANQLFLASDGEDLSTPELLRRAAAALGKPIRLLPVPAWLLEGGAALLGKRAMAQRLCGSLQLDIGKTRDLLGWTPPVSVDEGLRRTVKGFQR